MPKYNPNEPVPKFTFWQLLKFIYPFVRPSLGYFMLGTFFRVLGESSTLIFGLLTGWLVTDLTKSHTQADFLPLVWQSVYILGAYTANDVFNFAAKYFFYTFVSNTANMRLRQKSAEHMAMLDISWHEHENTGNKLERLNNGKNGFTTIIEAWINQIIPIVVYSTGVFVVFSYFDTILSVGTAIFFVIYFILSRYFSKQYAKAHYATVKASEDISGFSHELFSNIRTVRSLGNMLPLFTRLGHYIHELHLLITRRTLLAQYRTYVPQFFGDIMRFFMYLIVIWGILHGRYEIGFFVVFHTYLNNIWDAVGNLANFSETYIICKTQIYRLKQVMNEPIRIANETDKVPLPTDWQTIHIDNISFAYGENEVLKNLSLNIKRGQKIGIIGLSGAGKSTLFKLLLKEREGFSGSISFDNTPLNTISANSYFSRVAVVLQETEVFNFSVTDNITIGSEGNVNQQQLDQALEVSHVKDFLHKLPEGLDTLIGEKGFKLSGGEKQRLGIARAVYKQPELLLLDEATSHLDLESEQKIQDSLRQFFDSVTAIVIAHRLTTIREMDVIVVIEDGRIVEQGSFDDLMAKHGRFAELWDKQKI